jgi:hypothetical protein
VVADHAVGEQGDRCRGAPEELALEFHTDAAATIRVIDEYEFASVRRCLFQRGELAALGPKRNRNLFLVLRSWFFVGRKARNIQGANNQEQGTTNNERL